MEKIIILSTELLDEILESINLSEGEIFMWEAIRKRVKRGAIITLNSESILKMHMTPEESKKLRQ